MISGGGSSTSQTSSSRTAPWAGQAEYLKGLYAKAQGIQEGQPNQYYGDSTVAQQDPAMLEAYRRAELRGGAGSPVNQAAQNQAVQTLNGQYLSPESDPYLRQNYDSAARAATQAYQTGVLPSLRSRFEGGGRTQSGALGSQERVAQDQFGRNLTEMAASMYGANRNAERNRQVGMAGQAGGIAEQDYRDISALGSVGAQRQDQSQRVLDDLVQRFNFNQYEPSMRLSQFAQTLGGPVMENNAQSQGSGDSFQFGIGPFT